MMSKERMDMIVYGRRLRNAENSDLLQKVWEEMKENKMAPDKFIIDIYERRKRELQEQETEVVKISEE